MVHWSHLPSLFPYRRPSAVHRPEPEVEVNQALIDAVLARAAPITTPAQVRRDVHAMMTRFGIDPTRIPRHFARDVQQAKRSCARCITIGRCQHSLYEGTSDEPRAFCPNADLWGRIAAEMQPLED